MMKSGFPFRAALLPTPLAVLHAAEPTGPNVIVLLADDLGYGDVGCSGATTTKTQGCRSAAIGKLDLGYSKDWNQLPITGPREVGFDYHSRVPQNHNAPARGFIEENRLRRDEGQAPRPAGGLAAADPWTCGSPAA